MPSYVQGGYLWASTICTGSMGPLTLRIPYLQVIHTGQTFKNNIYMFQHRRPAVTTPYIAKPC